MQSITIRAVLVNKPNQRKLYAIKILITIDRKLTYRTTGIRVRKEEWDSVHAVIKKSVTNHIYLNAKIKKQIDEIHAEVLKKQLSGDHISVVNYNKPKYPPVAEYMQKIIEQTSSKLSEGRRVMYATELSRLNKFQSGITFNQVDVEFLRRYENHLLQEGLKNNTVVKVFNIIKAIFNRAIKDGVTTNYPFKNYESPKYKQPLRTFLLSEEVEKIEELLKGPLHDSLRNTACYFLLGCYSGLRFSDWQLFNHEKFIEGDRIILRTKKTGELVSLQMHSKLRTAVERIKELDPVISEQRTNDNLKVIAKLAGIKKNLSTHIARHSFAVRCAELDIPPLATAELMGITMKVVMVYYKLTNRKIDQEFAKWDK